MKTSVVVADGTFNTVTAALLGSYMKVAKEAAEIGYDALQLTVNRPKEVSADEVLEATRKYGLVVSSIASGLGYTMDGLSLGSKDEENRKGAVARMKEHVDLAVKLGGAKTIIGTIRGWTKDGGTLEVYKSQFRKSVEELMPYAEKYDTDVILEANNHTETDIYLTIKDTVDFIESIGSPRLKLHIDSMHMSYENQDPATELPRVARHIAQADISDTNRMAPDGKHIDFEAYINTLKKIGFNDYLVFEYRAQPPENAAKAGFDYIKGLLQQA